MIKKNKKTILLFLIALILISLIIFLIFVYRNNLLYKTISDVSVHVDKIVLKDNQDNFIYSEDLQPKFNIYFPEDAKIETSYFQIDESGNVLNDIFYGETNQEIGGRLYVFQPSYTLTPQKHNLVVQYFNFKGEKIVKKLNFILVFHETFDEPLEKSRAWLIPGDRPHEWFSIKDNKLSIVPFLELKTL